MSDIDSFRKELQSLISKFEKDKNYYLSKGYPEAQVRIDFINPFFEALGWDIENKAQKPPHERDVIVELSPETTRRPDYNFRINGATKFFVEAKAPSVALDDVNHILQAKSYAWSTKEVYFVVLTDFEEFRLYDASLKPNPKFPDEGLIFELKYTDYLDSIEKLYELSRERVEQGSLEALLPRDTKSKRLRIPPDKSFLEDLTEWRTELAKDIHKRNSDFDVRLLNDVVQKLLDRIIFIRIAEDRKIRQERELWEIVAQWKEEGKRKSIMIHLIDLFHEVNNDLNGDIFKRHACETADVDSNLLAEIIESLYFPKSRYRFDAIGVELLGSIYERYLGSTIRVTPQRVKVEEKPEVRKAGGVYYTPKYIVDYIVKNTVGKIIEGKTPRQIEKIKILDPACGSGSFLLGAYQYLIDYHLKYYREHPKEAQTLHLFPYYKMSPEEFTLPIREKAKILRNNIFGVDIDPQAVEITMMSLYLKALEGERGLLPKKQQLLPPLSNNIKCGNSLIGYDIFESPSPHLSHNTPLPIDAKAPVHPPFIKGGQGGITDETKSRINPFDWNSKSAGFGEIMENGGFDVVIGNPPYVRIQAMKEWAPIEVEFYKTKYKTAKTGNYDIYVVFVEKGLSLLKKNGYLGYILPHKFFQAQYGEPLRKLITENKSLLKIVDFTDCQIFEGASTYTNLLFLTKEPKKNFEYVQVRNPDDISVFLSESYKPAILSNSSVSNKPWTLGAPEELNLLKRLTGKNKTLKDVCNRIYQGVITSADPVFIFKNFRNKDKTHSIVFSKALDKEVTLEASLLKKVIRSGNVGRYFAEPKALVLFPYKIQEGKATIISQKELEKDYPLTWQYLKENKKVLEEREHGKFKNSQWYQFGRTQNIHMWEQPKLMIPYMITRLSAYLDMGDNYYFVNVTTGGYGITTTKVDLRYLTGLLNSKILDFCLKQISTNFRGGYFAANKQFIERLPIRTIDFNNPSEKSIHNKLVFLVDAMLELYKKKNSLPPSAEREKVEREIAVTDEKIDEIVYKLYGITEEEKKIIEGK